MEQIKKGIIEVNGITLDENTTLKDLEKIDIDKAVMRFHPHGYYELIFNRPIEKDGVAFQVSVKIAKNDGSKIILLDPKLNMPIHDIIDESRAKQEICEEWLKRNMGVEPTRDTNDGIFYDFPWGHIYSSAAEHINFGRLDGCIRIDYGEVDD